MNARIRTLILFVPIGAMVLAGCASPASPPAPTEKPAQASTAVISTSTLSPSPQATPATNAEIVLAMEERLNAGDVDGSLAYFADDASVYLYGLPPTGFEVYQGKDQIRTLWEDSVANHFQWEVEVSRVSDDEIFLTTNTWHDFTRDLGVAPLQYNDVYQVTNGKITAYASWITEDALGKFRPAFLEVVPPEPPAPPSTAPAVSEMTVTIANGICTTDLIAPLQAGELTVNVDVEDQDKSLYALILFNLDPGKDMLDAMVSTYDLPPSWMDIFLFHEIGPGRNATYKATLKEGPVYGICFSKPPDIVIGAMGPFEVQPVPAAVEPTPTVVEGPVSELLVSFTKGSCNYNGPLRLRRGEVTVTIDVKDEKSYALTFFTLDPGKTLQDLVAAQGMPSPPPWAKTISMQDTLPGTGKTYDISVEEGPVYMLCWDEARVIKSVTFDVEP